MEHLTFEQRIANGISYLDKEHPNWRSKINLDALSMASFSECIIGQVFGSYMKKSDDFPNRYNWSADYGFDIYEGYQYNNDEYNNDGYNNSFIELTDVWRKALSAN